VGLRREGSNIMSTITDLLQWFSLHPMAVAGLAYVLSVAAVLLYAYFEPRMQS